MRDLILQAAEHATGGNIRAFATLLQMPERTLRAWIMGENPVPGAAQVLFRILAEHPKMIRYAKGEHAK